MIICSCYCRAFSGRFCECDEGKQSHESECHTPNGQECSNRGKCECGKCNCEKGFVGKCCQYKISDADAEEKYCGGIGENACSGKFKINLIIILRSCYEAMQFINVNAINFKHHL